MRKIALALYRTTRVQCMNIGSTSMKRFKTRRWLVVVVVALLVLGGAGWWWWNTQQQAAAELIIVSPERKTLAQTLTVNGVVDSKEKARLFFATGGKVTYVGAQQGDWVKKGQTVVTIDNRTTKKLLEQDLNNYMNERLNWEQLRDDEIENDSGDEEPVPELRTRREIEQAQNRLENTVLTVEIRSIAIQDASLRSPIEGVLVKAPTSLVGVPLAPTDAFEIVNPATFFMQVAIDEVDIGSVRVGMPATIELDAYPDEVFDGRVRSIAFSSTQGSSSTFFLAEIELLQDPTSLPVTLRYGMNGDAEIQLSQVENALVIPIEATRSKDGQTVVDVQTGTNQFEERVIYIGVETDEEVEVIKGLEESDRVLLPF